MNWAKTKMIHSAGKQHKEHSEKSEMWTELDNSLAKEWSFYPSVADVLKSMSIIHSTQFWADSLLHSQDFLDNTSGDKEQWAIISIHKANGYTSRKEEEQEKRVTIFFSFLCYDADIRFTNTVMHPTTQHSL